MLLLSYLVVANDFYRKITSPHYLLSSPAHIMQRQDVIDSFLFVFSCLVLFFICCSSVCACAHGCLHAWRCMCDIRSSEASWERNRRRDQHQYRCLLSKVWHCSLLLPQTLFTYIPHSNASLCTLIDSFARSVLT